MSTERNKRLVRRFYEEVVNAGHVERVAAFVAPGFDAWATRLENGDYLQVDDH